MRVQGEIGFDFKSSPRTDKFGSASDGEDTEDFRSFWVITPIHATGCGEYFIWTGKIEDFDLGKDIDGNSASHTDGFSGGRRSATSLDEANEA